MVDFPTEVTYLDILEKDNLFGLDKVDDMMEQVTSNKDDSNENDGSKDDKIENSFV